MFCYIHFNFFFFQQFYFILHFCWHHLNCARTHKYLPNNWKKPKTTPVKRNQKKKKLYIRIISNKIKFIWKSKKKNNICIKITRTEKKKKWKQKLCRQTKWTKKDITKIKPQNNRQYIEYKEKRKNYSFISLTMKIVIYFCKRQQKTKWNTQTNLLLNKQQTKQNTYIHININIISQICREEQYTPKNI